MPAYKDEERKTWYVKFNYKDWTGKNKQKLKRGFKTKREALEFERMFLESLQGVNTDMKFSQLAASFLEDTKSRKKIQTYENRELILRLHLLPVFGDMKVVDITPLQVRKWQNEMLQNPKVKDTTLRHYHIVLSGVFNYGIKFYGVKTNPARLAGSVGSSKTSKDLIVWTVEHFNIFLNSLGTFREKVFYETLYFSGMRIGECLALSPDDIMWESNALRINKTFLRRRGRDTFGTTKTKSSERVVVMPSSYMEHLKMLIDSYYEKPQRIFFFITSSTGTDIRFKKLISELDVPPITPHGLRHSHASFLIDQGMPIALVAERLGHESINTTLKTYAHLLPGRDKELASRLDDFFG